MTASDLCKAIERESMYLVSEALDKRVRSAVETAGFERFSARHLQ